MPIQKLTHKMSFDTVYHTLSKHCHGPHPFRDILKLSELGNQRTPALKDTAFQGPRHCPSLSTTRPRDLQGWGQGQMIWLQSNTVTGTWAEAGTNTRSPGRATAGEGRLKCQRDSEGKAQSPRLGTEQGQGSWAPAESSLGSLPLSSD